MQSYARQIQDQIWDKLYKIFMKYTSGRPVINVSQL